MSETAGKGEGWDELKEPEGESSPCEASASTGLGEIGGVKFKTWFTLYDE
jgi:hypothetical protein